MFTLQHIVKVCDMVHITFLLCKFVYVVNRPGIDGAVTDYLIHAFADPFPPNLHNIVTPKPKRLACTYDLKL